MVYPHIIHTLMMETEKVSEALIFYLTLKI